MLTSCHRNFLRCRTEYLSPLYLASERADTPDPLRECFYGQQIIVKWGIPRRCLSLPVTLQLHVRYGIRENETIEVPIASPSGYWVYQIANQGYWCKEGIVSYKVELYQQGNLIDSWHHHLWAELIDIREEDSLVLKTSKTNIKDEVHLKI